MVVVVVMLVKGCVCVDVCGNGKENEGSDDDASGDEI